MDGNGDPVSLPSTQILFVQITNEMLKGSNFNLIPTTNREIVLKDEIFEEMKNSSKGTYQYNFTSTNVGKITISIILATQGRILAEYYDSTNFEGNNSFTRVMEIPQFYFNWGNGALYPNGRSDYVSARFNFYLKSPVTGSISYSIVADDSAALYIGKTITKLSWNFSYSSQFNSVANMHWINKILVT